MVVKISGNTATVTNQGLQWTASVAVRGTESSVSFTVDYQDLAGNVGAQVTRTNDASVVNIGEWIRYV